MLKNWMGNIGITVTTTAEVIEKLHACLSDGVRTRLFFINAHCYNVAKKDEEYRNNVNQAEIVLNDGVGVSIGAKIFGFTFPENLNGTDLTPKVLEMAAINGWRVYFLGGRSEVAAMAASNVMSRLPSLHMVGAQGGYFSDDPDVQASTVEHINCTSADILIVGRGVPIQEKWITDQWEHLDCKVAIAVGAYLDFESGVSKRAPVIVRRMKLEWMYRLLREPVRLGKRYLIGNFKFIVYVLLHRFSDAIEMQSRNF